MYILNGICYAGEATSDLKVTSAAYLGHRMFLLTFHTGEKRLLDATLLTQSVYAPLQDEALLKDINLFHGVITWNQGEIDIAPEAVYAISFPYTGMEAT